MEIKTYEKQILKTTIPKQMYKKSYLLKKGVTTISNIDILNRFLKGLKDKDFNVSFEGNYLVLETDKRYIEAHKKLMVVV